MNWNPFACKTPETDKILDGLYKPVWTGEPTTTRSKELDELEKHNEQSAKKTAQECYTARLYFYEEAGGETMDIHRYGEVTVQHMSDGYIKDRHYYSAVSGLTVIRDLLESHFIPSEDPEVFINLAHVSKVVIKPSLQWFDYDQFKHAIPTNNPTKNDTNH